ncbi:helix-turn-helix domain-containing protein [Bradyrhizobium elkanii]|uniref:helix-turn-helix domain-containing protein n=1 Tax=Bradyrhizobium elkanii TaxID=29448 RepID=UPI0004AF7D8F|nr:helix-turn-helix transcriptional regulator [Bradyrhizobium elkanii]WLA79543.1 helix-turn-helix transcriptional regulator [Bradyrhizobium elkanii]
MASKKTTALSNKRGTTPIDALIGQRVRMRRMELHISQSDLGDKLGVSFQQIQKYEKGVNRVGASRLQQLAGILDTDMAYFLADSINGKAAQGPSKLSAFLATKDGLEFVEAGMKLNQVYRRGLTALARTLSTTRA